MSTPTRRPSFLSRISGSTAPDSYSDIPTYQQFAESPRLTSSPLGNALTASARKLTGRDIMNRNKGAQGGAGSVSEWQEEAWELLDWIGEHRFIANTLAGSLSQADLFVGKVPAGASPGTAPLHIDEPEVQKLLDAVGDGPGGRTQLLHRLSMNLFVAGEGWLIGIPPHLVPGTPEQAATLTARAMGTPVTVDRSAADDSSTDVLSLVWRMFSVSEVDVDQSGLAKLRMEGGETLECSVDELWPIRIWRAHPRRAWEADSPTRASLPVLRELLGLTQHVSAQIDSRLAGAGLLVVSSTASSSLKRAAGLSEDSADDPLMDALMEAMVTPIKDRSSAAAVVPLAITVPDEVVDKIKHITFSTPLDKEARQLRDEAIRRLALGLDAPPELLLGTGGMNHWGAWLVREDVVTTHLEPSLALICDALTTQYLRPILEGMGRSPEEASQYQVWYDVDHMVTRPNRSGDAKDLYAAGAINDRALREATGFEETDAPEKAADIDLAVSTALSMVAQAPSLAQSPGLENLVAQLRAVLGTGPATPPQTDEDPASTEGGGHIPNTQNDPPPSGTSGNPEGGIS